LEHIWQHFHQKIPNLWKDKWIFHHNNAHSLTAVSGKHFLAKKQKLVLEHPQYLHGLIPYDYVMFWNKKIPLKGFHF
jgi:hypothetical protein